MVKIEVLNLKITPKPKENKDDNATDNTLLEGKLGVGDSE